MDEHKLLQRANYLAWKLFVDSEEGQEFQRLMIDLDVKTAVNFNQHGELAARAGAMELWRRIHLMARNYQQMIENEKHNKERVK